jgi:alpha-tubulin suppressor-like RCC1 family protein
VTDPNGVLVGKKITGLALANTGTVCVVASNVPYCWGRGQYGALGDNTTSDRYYPSAVTTSGVLANKTITDITAGDGHVCVVASGAAYCWGANGSGRIGDGSTTQRNTPVAVSTSGVLSGKTVTNIAGESGTTCAVASGAAYCWGDDTNGNLGNDTTIASSTTPVAVNASGVLSGKTIKSIGSGGNHACVLATDGTVGCWGQNSGGQLGNNSTTLSAVPVAIVTTGDLLGKTVASIGVGDYRSCAIDTNSKAYCWGLGPVGNGTSSSKLVPTVVTSVSTLNGMNIVQVAPSVSGNCFLNDQNAVYCTAANADGSLGNNTSNASNAPVQVLFTSTFNAPNYRLYANANSATPGSPLAGINTPATLPAYGQEFRVRMGIKTTAQIGGMTLGSDSACGLSNGMAYCWGANTYGQLGNNVTVTGNSANDSSTPVAVYTSGVLSGKTIRTISSGWDHTCAIASDNQAYCWGAGSNGELGNNVSLDTATPVAVTTSGVLSGKTILSISTGFRHTCAIASDNQAYCWGVNTNGQLGNNSTTQSLVPVAVNTAGVLSGKTILSISAGINSTCAVASDNLAYCWGYNATGQLGNNSTTQSLVPVAVNTSGVLSGKTIRSISTTGVPGDIYGLACVVASDDKAYCWGSGVAGELGNNSTSDSHVPVAVNTSGVLSGKTIRSVVTSPFGACALASDNKVYCWGIGGQGDLGNNSTSDSLVPVAVNTSGVLTGKTVTTLLRSPSHECVVTQENPGTYYCWGSIYNGQFGIGVTTASYLVPTDVTPLTDGYIPGANINTGDNTYKLQFAQKTVSTCSAQTGFADVTGATAIAFNTNAGVSSGASITSNANDPVPTTDSVPLAYISASGTFTNPSTITGGKTGLWDFSLKDNSGLYATTYCLRMTYGDGTPVEGTVQYPEFTTSAKVSANESSYRMYQNANSATPGSPLANTDAVATISGLGQAFRVRTGLTALSGGLTVKAGDFHTCGIAAGQAYCWGSNATGQLGNADFGTNYNYPTPVDTTGVLAGKTILSIAGGSEHTCAIASDHQAYCWGNGDNGRLGNNDTGASDVPVAVDTSGVLAGKTILSIVAGYQHTCAIASDHQAYCWGDNTYGQLGDGSGVPSYVPVAVSTAGALSGKTILSIYASGSSHTCVIASDNLAYCWGYGEDGQLGNGVTFSSSSPVQVNTSSVLPGQTVVSLATAWQSTCAIGSDGKAYCWGNNASGQLGDGSNSASALPVAVQDTGVLSGKTLTSITADGTTACALDSAGAAYCWGNNTNGQLGNGSLDSNSTFPVAVDTSGVLSGKTAVTITSGDSHACVTTSDNGVYCWGNGTSGQLGDGTTNTSNIPVSVDTSGAPTGGDITTGANAYKLQYAQKTVSTCSAQTGYADVTASSAIAFNTNGSVSNGASITSTANDPIGSSDSVMQTYISAAGTFTNSSTIPSGKTGLWDFSLKENAGVDDTGYCLRIVYSDGTTISGSIQYPELLVDTKQPAIAAPYRFYQNANSLTPGSPLGVTNQAASLTSPGQAFRLRTGVMGTLSATKVASGGSHNCVIASADSNVYCWGLGSYGQLGNNSTTYSFVPTPADTSGVLSSGAVSDISTGGSYTCVIAAGDAICWGLNTNGQLGNNATAQSNVPVAVDKTGALSGKSILAISAGTSHTCAIASDNNAYCWGLNTNGQLGNNSVAESHVPVPVDTSGVLSGKSVVSIQVGTSHTCAIASDSKAYCWGLNTSGQLGNNSTTESHVPVAVYTAGVLSGKTILSLSAGNIHNCVIASDNNAYCWGNGGNGRLGNNSGTQSQVPVAVNTAGVLAGKTIASIAAGGSHTCAIASDNLLYCWGYNANGYLGNNSTTQSQVPVAVDTSGALNGKTIASVASKFYETCALSSDNQVYCWGNNGSAQIGVGDVAATYLTPQRVVNYLPGRKIGVEGKTPLAVSAGYFHTCTIASDNQAYCWGYDSDGQLGGGAITSSIGPQVVPVDTSGVLSGKTILSISSGYYHTCAIASDNQAYCWGSGGSGKLGNNSGVDSSVPVAVDTTGVLAGKTILSISAAPDHTCAIASDNQAYCWGSGTYGQLGNNTPSDSLVPVAVNTSGALSGKTIVSISAGWNYTCAIASDNNAYCWGLNTSGQLGNNSTSQSNVPVAVNTAGVLSGKTVRSISTGNLHTCAIASDNQAYCWGSGSSGRLGNNSTSQSLVPVAVTTTGVLSGKTVLSITNGYMYTCAIASDNQAYCWGSNADGQLGNNSTAYSSVPVAVTASGALAGKTILSIDAGNSHTCAIASDNQLYCWGNNDYAQLGDNSFTTSLVPTLGYTLQYTPIHTANSASTNTYVLQYAQKSASTCSAQSTGFAAVTASTPIAFNTNASVTNGAAISTTANDPLSSTFTSAQTYISAQNTFTNGNAISAGSMGMWDFSLKDNGAPYNTSYCLRIAYNDGTALTDAQALPEVRTTTGSLSVGFVNTFGVDLSNPTTTLGTITTVTSSPQTATGSMGSSSQKLRIFNDVATNGWSASIAATAGPTALWDRTDHLAKYDFNDASGGVDGGDSDSLGGALTLFPNNGTLTSPFGCSTSGISLGSTASFNEGTLNSITLMNANSSAAMGCAYDLTGIGLSQAVPAAQATGTYTLDMTITVVAL